MKQYAIIGMSKFGRFMLDELLKFDCEILVVDKKRDLIESVKDLVTSAFIADAINEETIQRLIPRTIDAAIVDMGDSIEVSLLVTNYLKKMGIRKIVAKAESREHGEILEIIGATHVVFPNREAAKRMAPMILSDSLFNYFPIGDDLVIAEVKIPKEFAGKTIVEADLRKNAGANIIALKREDGYHQFINKDYTLDEDEVVLVACSPEDLAKLSGESITEPETKRRGGLMNIFG
ncbi:MAG: TrkA family potassium uptake protein [Spirochaetia bacterium]|nr:TrkA family potassium uptake protein [Spirochaetia bacterium]MCF7941812.1 TrkA family potassium uptake protein [Spirochaetia bacterium]